MTHLWSCRPEGNKAHPSFLTKAKTSPPLAAVTFGCAVWEVTKAKPFSPAWRDRQHFLWSALQSPALPLAHHTAGRGHPELSATGTMRATSPSCRHYPTSPGRVTQQLRGYRAAPRWACSTAASPPQLPAPGPPKCLALHSFCPGQRVVGQEVAHSSTETSTFHSPAQTSPPPNPDRTEVV